MRDAADDHELVLPFVVVKSNGGQFDDEPWVAGFECGRYDALMNFSVEHGVIANLLAESTPVHTANLPQLDLLAMHHGLTMKQMTIEETPEWSWVCFAWADASSLG